MTRALAVDKSNKAGDVYGKMLVLTFEDNEDAMMNRILSFINTRDEITQMSDLNNHLLNFKGILIDEVQRVIIRENQEIDLTYTEFEILKLLAKHPGIVFSKEQIYDIVWKESYSGDYNIVMSHIRNIREKIEDNPSKPIYIHVETVCLLSKLHEAKHHVNVRLDMDEMDLTAAERR